VDYGIRPVSDEAYRRFLAKLGSYAVDGSRFAVVSDMSRMTDVPSAAHGWIFSEWLRRHGPELRNASVGNAIVAGAAAMRVVTSTSYWWHRDKPSFRLFDDMGEATTWCHTRLRRASVPAGSAPAAEPVWVPEPPPEGVAPYDLLNEPVFLVQVDGRVAFANRAARLAFGEPPAWVSETVSSEPSSRSFPARVARVSSRADSLFVVIPNAGASLPELPPSLERMADLVCRGFADKEIAERTGLTLSTVRTYIRRLFRRTGVHSRAELVHRWYANGPRSTDST